MSRFDKITRSQMIPPACSLFQRHANDEQWYFDTGLQIDEGAVYISQSEFEDMASVAGWVSPEKYNKLLNAYKELADEYNANLTILTGIRSGANGLLSSLTDLSALDLDTNKAARRSSSQAAKS